MATKRQKPTPKKARKKTRRPQMRAEPYSLLVLANQCRALGSLDGTIPLSPEHRTALIDAARALRRNVSRIARGDHQQA